ncbi:MAG: MazG nucleotide pyrophosphohydrolase domain-containing protein [Caldisericia bacterium]
MGRAKEKKNLIDEIIRYQNDLKEKYGFDWDNVFGVVDKLKEETRELEEVLLNNDSDKIEEEFGDILITIVNLSRFLKLDIYDVLNKSFIKFKKRVQKMKKEAQKEKLNLEKLDISELDKLWDESKK